MRFGRTHADVRAQNEEMLAREEERGRRGVFLLFPRCLEDGTWVWLERCQYRVIRYAGRWYVQFYRPRNAGALT